MAAARSGGKAQVGSTRWVLDERAQAGQFIEQEVEEFAFSARNELEWLNEHMSEIFSRNQLYVQSRWQCKLPRENRLLSNPAMLPKSSRHRESYEERHLVLLESILQARTEQYVTASYRRATMTNHLQ